MPSSVRDKASVMFSTRYTLTLARYILDQRSSTDDSRLAPIRSLAYFRPVIEEQQASTAAVSAAIVRWHSGPSWRCLYGPFARCRQHQENPVSENYRDYLRLKMRKVAELQQASPKNNAFR